MHTATPNVLALPRLSTPASSRAVKLQSSDWETDFFGARMGALVRTEEPSAADPDTLARDLMSALDQARRERYAHVIFRADVEDVASIWAAERAGLRLVDVGVDSAFTFATTPLPALTSSLSIRAGVPDDVPALRAIATNAFPFTRFSVDPFFSPQQVTAFYQQWATNLFVGLAQAVMVCEIDAQVAGFVSCAMKDADGRIPLIATAAAYRGRGVGRALVASALAWFAAADARVARVKTQAANYPALALYHRSGFCVSRTELAFSATLRPSARS